MRLLLFPAVDFKMLTTTLVIRNRVKQLGFRHRIKSMTVKRVKGKGYICSMMI
jgi:hypothetical protein